MSASDIMDAWLVAANAGDVDGLLGMYHERAVLIPTFSNRFSDTPGKIRAYFEALTARPGLAVEPHKRTVHYDSLGGDIATAAGIYLWRFEVEDEMLNFEARFSYVFDLSNARPIMQHHSSQLPRML
ncbi:MAG: DUF4440 domain-containing protein [Planctomycetota bacterium]|jgi:hypothetical protein|nr:DUF4440 domain-containing protein [Planctomycetota bacterium]